MDLHQEANKVQASIQISRQSQQRNQEGITSQSLIQSRIADTSVQNVGQRPKNKEHEARNCYHYGRLQDEAGPGRVYPGL